MNLDSFIQTFTSLVVHIAPYAIVWRIGEYIVSVLLDAICGGRGRGGGKMLL